MNTICKNFRRRDMSQILAAASIILLMAACSPQVDDRGHIEDEPIDKAVIPQQTTQDQVMKQFGSPSSISTFGPETWYYITSHKERFAFLAPKITAQHVTEIEFGGDGVVRRIQDYELKDGKKIHVVSATTPTEGHELGFFEQIMSNLGRFNKKKDSNAESSPARRPNIPH